METIVNPYEIFLKKLLELTGKVDAIQSELRSLDPSARSVVPRQVFQEKFKISDSDFYKKAPKGLVPGAMKYGTKWFVDLDKFENEMRHS